MSCAVDSSGEASSCETLHPGLKYTSSYYEEQVYEASEEYPIACSHQAQVAVPTPPRPTIPSNQNQPVRILGKNAVIIDLPPLEWHGYTRVPKILSLANTGRTILIDGQWVHGRPYITGGPLNGAYLFSQIHFHSPSEHEINGKRYPIEMHVVHYKTSYLTQERAMQEKDGTVVLVYLFEVIDTSETSMSSLTKLTPKIEKLNSRAEITDVSLAQILEPFTSQYFVYSGSIITQKSSFLLQWIISGSVHSVAQCEARELLDLLNACCPINSRTPKMQPENDTIFYVDQIEQEVVEEKEEPPAVTPQTEPLPRDPPSEPPSVPPGVPQDTPPGYAPVCAPGYASGYAPGYAPYHAPSYSQDGTSTEYPNSLCYKKPDGCKSQPAVSCRSIKSYSGLRMCSSQKKGRRSCEIYVEAKPCSQECKVKKKVCVKECDEIIPSQKTEEAVSDPNQKAEANPSDPPAPETCVPSAELCYEPCDPCIEVKGLKLKLVGDCPSEWEVYCDEKKKKKLCELKTDLRCNFKKRKKKKKGNECCESEGESSASACPSKKSVEKKKKEKKPKKKKDCERESTCEEEEETKKCQKTKEKKEKKKKKEQCEPENACVKSLCEKEIEEAKEKCRKEIEQAREKCRKEAEECMEKCRKERAQKEKCQKEKVKCQKEKPKKKKGECCETDQLTICEVPVECIIATIPEKSFDEILRECDSNWLIDSDLKIPKSSILDFSEVGESSSSKKLHDQDKKGMTTLFEKKRESKDSQIPVDDLGVNFLLKPHDRQSNPSSSVMSPKSYSGDIKYEEYESSKKSITIPGNLDTTTVSVIATHAPEYPDVDNSTSIVNNVGTDNMSITIPMDDSTPVQIGMPEDSCAPVLNSKPNEFSVQVELFYNSKNQSFSECATQEYNLALLYNQNILQEYRGIIRPEALEVGNYKKLDLIPKYPDLGNVSVSVQDCVVKKDTMDQISMRAKFVMKDIHIKFIDLSVNKEGGNDPEKRIIVLCDATTQCDFNEFEEVAYTMEVSLDETFKKRSNEKIEHIIAHQKRTHDHEEDLNKCKEELYEISERSRELSEGSHEFNEDSHGPSEGSHEAKVGFCEFQEIIEDAFPEPSLKESFHDAKEIIDCNFNEPKEDLHVAKEGIHKDEAHVEDLSRCADGKSSKPCEPLNLSGEKQDSDFTVIMKPQKGSEESIKESDSLGELSELKREKDITKKDAKELKHLFSNRKKTVYFMYEKIEKDENSGKKIFVGSFRPENELKCLFKGRKAAKGTTSPDGIEGEIKNLLSKELSDELIGCQNLKESNLKSQTTSPSNYSVDDNKEVVTLHKFKPKNTSGKSSKKDRLNLVVGRALNPVEKDSKSFKRLSDLIGLDEEQNSKISVYELQESSENENLESVTNEKEKDSKGKNYVLVSGVSNKKGEKSNELQSPSGSKKNTTKNGSQTAVIIIPVEVESLSKVEVILVEHAESGKNAVLKSGKEVVPSLNVNQ